ncbi:MAG: DNA translocase FtsK 4TM domain-containing protein [Paludibacteraceae bacterium]|nr:DNA translocase FtsK 4TM domain-containing protein [Paludibacteraceae bacterium]
MARRVTRPTAAPTTTGRQKPITVENTGIKEFFLSVRDVVMSDRFRIATGVIMAAVVLMLVVAYFSFFLTGAEDYSIVKYAGDRSEMRGEIQNTLGLPGAIVADWLVDGTFGVMSIIALIALGLYAARLIVEFPLRRWRLLFISLFLLVWSAVALGFAQQIIGMGSFFRWGGTVGEVVSKWAMSYVQWFGLLIILLATMIVFLIVIDKHFVEHCQRIGDWIKRLFTKPKTEEEIDESEIEEEQPSEPIKIVLENTTADTTMPEEPAIVVDVEVAKTEEEIVAEEVEEDIDIEENVEVSVEEVKEVELSEDDPEYLLRKLGPYDPRKDLELYKFPSLNLLKVYDNETAPVINQEEQQANANRIVTTLRNYGIEIESIKATVGPTVTLYEIVPQAGVRISKIQNLESDIMLSLSAMGIRIIAPIPGKGTIGIEVPNENPQTVSMHSVIASKRFQEEKKMRLPIAYGRTITNEVFMFDLAKTPHLLVAGATGTGKSVAINAIITSLLYKKHPAELKLVMVDPKMVEFAPYKPLLRHYLAATPDTEDENIVITDCDKVVNTLNSLVIEMENRYKLLMDAGVRNLEDYNEKFVARRLNPEKLVADSLHHQFLPYIVIIIDEYGDFIMQAGKQVETPIARITQKARAVGMHMILATQRPSVNIVTGVIKANIPTRIALRTQSVIDSRTVLDGKGAEQLIGRGDSLYSGNANVTRVQCAFVDTPEVDAIVEHIEKQQHYFEPYQLPEYIPEGSDGEALAPGAVDLKRLDPMFADVARYVVTKQEGSTSRLQRAFEIGYNRAGKLSDQLEAAGIVGPNKGPKGRDVLIQSLDELDKKLQELGC